MNTREEAKQKALELGLNNMQVNEVREAFERVDRKGLGVIGVADVPTVMEDLGFELTSEDIERLVAEHGVGVVDEVSGVSLSSVLSMFKHLDETEHGLNFA